MIKIAIADDEALFRKGLCQIIKGFEGIEVILEASNGEQLLELLDKVDLIPEVLLLDLNMPKLNGIETSKKLRQFYPTIKIIVLSTYFSKAFIINMIELGAAAYLPKNSMPETVERTITDVMEKGFAYSHKVLEVIRENMITKSKPKTSILGVVELTQREREILQLICEEYKTEEIAQKLYISPRTVDGHRNNLLQKSGCRNTAGLVVFALQHNLVNLRPDRFWKK